MLARSPEPKAHDKVLDNNPGRIGIWKCWFLRRGENRRTRRKTSRSKEEIQQQTRPTWRRVRESNPGQASALTTAPSLLPRSISPKCFCLNLFTSRGEFLIATPIKMRYNREYINPFPRHLCTWIIRAIRWLSLGSKTSRVNFILWTHASPPSCRALLVRLDHSPNPTKTLATQAYWISDYMQTPVLSLVLKLRNVGMILAM